MKNYIHKARVVKKEKNWKNLKRWLKAKITENL